MPRMWTHRPCRVANGSETLALPTIIDIMRNAPDGGLSGVKSSGRMSTTGAERQLYTISTRPQVAAQTRQREVFNDVEGLDFCSLRHARHRQLSEAAGGREL